MQQHNRSWVRWQWPSPVTQSQPRGKAATPSVLRAHHIQRQAVKKGKSFLLAATQETLCLPKKSSDHSHPTDFFVSFSPPKNTLFKESWEVLCVLTSHCERQSRTFFLKKWNKISGQKVTLAHLFWIKIVLVNQILSIFNGAIGSLKLLFTKHKCFSLQSTAKAEWASFLIHT